MTDIPAPAGDAHRSAASTVDGVDVDAVAAAVTSCPSVSGLGAGGVGSAMTLLPGRRVPGVQVFNSEVRVEVRARWGATAAMLAREVRDATGPLLAGHRLHVLLADIDTPEPFTADTAAVPEVTVGQGGSNVPAASPDRVDLSPVNPTGPADSPAAPSAPPEAAGSEIDPSDRPASPS